MNTPYAILTETGVGVGASSPALKRLEKSGLLTSTPGPRNRLSYAITEKGDSSLRNALQAGVKAYGRVAARGVYDTLHRVIFFAWIKGSLDEAHEALDKAEGDLTRKTEKTERELQEYRKLITSSEVGASPQVQYAAPEYLTAVYRFIEAAADAAEAKLQVEALGSLRQLIDQLPATPRTFLQDSPLIQEDPLETIR